MYKWRTNNFELVCIFLQVINEYRSNGDEFLKKVFIDVKYLEKITALSEYELINDELEVM